MLLAAPNTQINARDFICYTDESVAAATPARTLHNARAYAAVSDFARKIFNPKIYVFLSEIEFLNFFKTQRLSCSIGKC